MINIKKMTSELRDANIKIGGISENGIVWDMNNNKIQDRSDVVAVILAHDPWEYSLSPQLPLVRVGGSATVQISGAPGVTNILIDGDAIEVTIDDSGHVTEIFDVLTVGEYVITGESGELANCVAVIKAVG